MSRFLRLNTKVAFAIFVIADLVCVGMGMGVPIFCIGFGFLVGWYLAKRATITTENVREVLRTVLIHAVVTSAFTFVVMSVLWGPTISMLLDPDSDFANFGIPLILYDPKLSFIGWLVLMILISPFLQLLTTLFSSYLTVLTWARNEGQARLKTDDSKRGER
jgi:hypothetical protein